MLCVLKRTVSLNEIVSFDQPENMLKFIDKEKSQCYFMLKAA